MVSRGLKPEGRAVEQVAALQDEQAQAQADGSLLIWVDTPHGAVSMRIEPGQWAWAPQK